MMGHMPGNTTDNILYINNGQADLVQDTRNQAIFTDTPTASSVNFAEHAPRG